ncbi:MAG: hypothetical protein PUP46_02420 [Endozoicomonas sp. (ex Botrylloides leachii)]|nr:hypothetical protein [Endozoicomonas sp. (ex Botrylloides leachii)]
MANINTQYLENNELTPANPVEAVKPVSPVEATESDRFSKLLNAEEDNQEITSIEEGKEELSLEELQKQFRDSTFRVGFNKTIEKAKEIVKEMKE